MDKYILISKALFLIIALFVNYSVILLLFSNVLICLLWLHRLCFYLCMFINKITKNIVSNITMNVVILWVGSQRKYITLVVSNSLAVLFKPMAKFRLEVVSDTCTSSCHNKSSKEFIWDFRSFSTILTLVTWFDMYCRINISLTIQRNEETADTCGRTPQFVLHLHRALWNLTYIGVFAQKNLLLQRSVKFPFRINKFWMKINSKICPWPNIWDIRPRIHETVSN